MGIVPQNRARRFSTTPVLIYSDAPSRGWVALLKNGTLWTFVAAVLTLVLQFAIMTIHRGDAYRLAAIEKRLDVAQQAYTALVTFKRSINSQEDFLRNGERLDDIVVNQGLYLADTPRHLILAAGHAAKEAERFRKLGNFQEQQTYIALAGRKADEATVALVVAARLTPAPEESGDGINL